MDSAPMVSPWSLWMLLFVAVNAHAVCASIRSLWAERRTSQTHRQRKRLRGDVGAIVWTRASESQAKRRRVGRGHETHETFRRELPACPWPVHVSFTALDIVGDSERRVAAWLAHPLVAGATAKLRDVLQNALQEVLVSCLSFALCSLAVVLLRRYSTLVVGVSVDLGAFSLEV